MKKFKEWIQLREANAKLVGAETHALFGKAPRRNAQLGGNAVVLHPLTQFQSMLDAAQGQITPEIKDFYKQHMGDNAIRQSMNDMVVKAKNALKPTM